MEDLINARCGWAGTDELYIKYHDEEWGQPVTDDRTLFEFLVLESAQAGLSWITILRKREGYREAFHHFDVEKVAQMTQEDIERLMQYDGIVNNFKTLSQVPATSPESDAMSKDMRKRGFKFFGSTICYAFLQAAGFVNDHLEDCFCKAVR